MSNANEPDFPRPGACFGLSKREYFAAKALQGYLAAFAGADISMPTGQVAAVEAAYYADALLAELAKEKA